MAIRICMTTAPHADWTQSALHAEGQRGAMYLPAPAGLHYSRLYHRSIGVRSAAAFLFLSGLLALRTLHSTGNPIRRLHAFRRIHALGVEMDHVDQGGLGVRLVVFVR